MSLELEYLLFIEPPLTTTADCTVVYQEARHFNTPPWVSKKSPPGCDDLRGKRIHREILGVRLGVYYLTKVISLWCYPTSAQLGAYCSIGLAEIL